MNYSMHLAKMPFEQIKNGTKTLEIRLNDEKRQKIKIGDTISFSYEDKTITVEVVNMFYFPSFLDLFTQLGGASAGFSENSTPEEMITEMKKYYAEEEEKKYGVVGIEIKLIT